ncbi:hypothetical protein BEWA_029970 [Theileria equi strain WA]|uniref:Uncharacterized protein n=1 Tax=Theileria equi strain WA TaxID=1537102 RepID=L0AX57_THEEQ|nr:hypothetical protein BEWA_029970 [Theileria equi strain WA]AFZ80145.1 hypothetical protein BEWA_029970 [Theileria equi strain WA]|eukprot:XP_004829811.1 hypothetical protein BEWA_029970 [Theileria equi strain WA]
MDAKKVIVYFCNSEVTAGKTADNPLLIYLPDVSGKQWFRKPDGDSINIWSSVSDVSLKDDTNNKSIVNFLDTIESVCQPPKVTINIYNRPDSGIIYTTYDCCNSSKKSQIINVNRNHHRRGILNGFTEYTHRSQERASNYFTVKEFKYNTQSITEGLRGMYKVTSVSVYYWTILEAPTRKGPPDERGRPLLIKVVVYEPGKHLEEKWYENNSENYNTKWNKVGDDAALNLSSDKTKLKYKLDILNCKLNNAVVINVSKKPDPPGTGTKTYDACEENTLDPSHGTHKMEVEDTPVGKLGSYECYTHTLKDSSSGPFHVVSFKNGSHIITFDGPGTPTLPILDVKEVKVYICKEDEKPLLLFYKTGSYHHWYKNNGPKDPAGKWEKVKDTPDSPQDHEQIIEEIHMY